MLYPVYVHMGDAQHAHGVTFPDFEGCFAAADEWTDLPGAIQEAVQAHFYGEPETVPPPSALEVLAANPAYRGGVWLLADVDVSRIDTRPVRLNVSLPSNLVQQIDDWASAHHMTRSGFLAKAALEAMRA
jgi:predicted RNase H-like HicB family nuclease